MTTPFDICIYHAPCQDGFTAAWAIYRRWPGMEFAPGVYGEAPPDIDGKRGLIVDFSYKQAVLREMGARAHSITILDHHKSAAADLEPFARHPLMPPEEFRTLSDFNGSLPIQALFDMDRSGAMMAWNYSHPGEVAPALVQHVQDRDLWRFALPNTREIAADLFSRPYLFDVWNDFAVQLEQTRGRADIVAGGAAIERKHHKDIAELLKQSTREMVIGGHRVRVANIPYTMSSDAANTLAEGAAFGACYYDAADGQRVFSLRSKDGGADVSAIASSYGGGGHARAAGFRAPRGWEGDSATAANLNTTKGAGNNPEEIA